MDIRNDYQRKSLAQTKPISSCPLASHLISDPKRCNLAALNSKDNRRGNQIIDKDCSNSGGAVCLPFKKE